MFIGLEVSQSGLEITQFEFFNSSSISAIRRYLDIHRAFKDLPSIGEATTALSESAVIQHHPRFDRI
jgi:hypothetical protein